MNMKWIKNVLMLCFLITVILFSNNEKVYAKTDVSQQQEQGLKAYKSKLLKIVKNGAVSICGTSFSDDSQFEIIDLNHDGVDELIMQKPGWQWYIYTYYGGKMKEVAANSGLKLFVYQKGELACYTRASTQVVAKTYFKITKGKYKQVAYSETSMVFDFKTNQMSSQERYQINGKDVSDIVFKKYIKKYTKKSTETEVTYQDITAQNVKKIK